MGKTVSAVTSGLIMDRGISKGVGKAQAGYNQAIGSISQGKQDALNMLSPYTGLGGQATNLLSTLLMGKSFDPSTNQFSDVAPQNRLSAFFESPDYQFNFSEGMRALEASQAARSGLLSSRAMREAQRYGSGLASGQYENYLSNLFKALDVGQASAGKGANIITDTAGQIGQAQIGIGNVSMQGKLARAKNLADTSSAVIKGFGGAATGGMGASGMFSPDMLAAMGASDINLKTDIVGVGESPSGIPIYHFKYRGSDKTYEGVMAQDILEINPEAVNNKHGFLTVDYDQLDVQFKEV